MLSKIVVLYEIYSKKLQWPNTFGTSLWLFSCGFFWLWIQKYEVNDVVLIRVMVFNATFNNMSVISWRSVLLVGETGVPGVPG